MSKTAVASHRVGQSAGPNSAPPLALKCLEELRSWADDAPGWLWQGYLMAGNITLLTSQWKAGKTTLVAVLLMKLREGGTFLGLPLRAGKAVVISEEGPRHWLDRAELLPFGPNVRWLCRPFRGRPQPGEWQALIDQLAAEHEKEPIDLLVIDPLTSFLPGRTENDAASMLDMLLPLQRLAAAGISVLVLHHPKKGESAPGQAARGSGALTSCVDIIVEMNWFGRGQEDDRRRRLLAFSRHTQTPRRLLIELSAAGTDYVAHGDFIADDFEENWQVLRGVLEDAHNKLTRREIAAAWPDDYPKPASKTLWRWLDRAMEEKRVLRDGAGRRRKPFRYWLVGQEAVWKTDPLHFLDQQSLEEMILNAQTRQTMARLAKPRSKKGRGTESEDEDEDSE